MDENLLKELNDSIKELNNKFAFLQDVFTAEEAAAYLRIGYDTILRLTRIGDIEYVPNGRFYLYKKEFLNRWLEKHKEIKQGGKSKKRNFIREAK